MEYVFHEVRTPKQIVRETIDGEKLLFYPNNMGRPIKHIRMGAIPPSTPVDWVIASVL